MAEAKEQTKRAIDNVADKAKTATDWVAEKTTDLRHTASDAVNAAHDRAVGAARHVVDGALKAKDKVGSWVEENAGGAMESLSEAGATTKESLNRMTKDLSHVIEKHPLTAVAIGFGIGMLLGRSVSRA